MMRLFATIFSVFFSLHAFANTELEWQRIELEKLIDNHYSMALSKLLERDSYHVKSKVTYNDPGMPRFDDLNQGDIKISDIDFDDSKGDYIAFSKVGLEVPVIESFYKENQRRLREHYRLSESYSLFKNIEAIDLKVVFSSKLDPKQVEAAKKVIEATRFDIAGIATNVTYQSQEITYTKETEPLTPEAQAEQQAKEEEKANQTDFLELLGRFGNAIGMVLATIILGVLTYIILKKYMQLLKELQEIKNPTQDKVESKQDEKEDDEKKDEKAENELDQFINQSDLNSFEKISSFFEMNQDIGVLMTKRWLNDRSPELEVALRALAQQMDHKKLEELQDGLSFIDREIWSGLITTYLDGSQIIEANKTIIKEIIREVVSGQKIDDYELVNLLLGLESETATAFIRAYPQEGGILLNLLTPSFASKILEGMDNEEVSNAVRCGLETSVPTDKAGLEKFKKLISDFKSKKSLKPFNYKIIQMLSEVTPEKEVVLYNFLAKNNQTDKMIISAKKMLPSELVLKLPEHIIKNMLQNYPIAQKTQLLISLGTEQSEEILNIIAEEGTTARDMINMEMENIESDEVGMARINRERENIWKAFVSYSRHFLLDHSDYEQEIDSLVRAWATEKVQRESRAN